MTNRRTTPEDEGIITITKTAPRKERISLYITAKTAQRLEEAAEDLNTSKNELVNRAIIALLDEIDSD